MRTNVIPSEEKSPQTKTPGRASYRIFNQAERFAQGWYWVVRSHTLTHKRPQSLSFLGQQLTLFRQASGHPVAVSTQTYRNLKQKAQLESVISTWPIAERYGLVWLWIGDEGTEVGPLPHVPELGDRTCNALLGGEFNRKCHPNVLLINAIDANHFNSVHNLPLDIHFDIQALNNSAIEFHNTTRGGEASRFVRFIRPLYSNEVTYSMCYWYGNTGTVTLGPDFLHFYLMFALRPGEGGTTEGQMIMLTPSKTGIKGWLFNQLLLRITQLVAAYFAKGDRHVFDSIRFDFRVPLAADRSISQFIKHVEKQPALAWKTWKLKT
ncbi:MAG: aromatic ring-hydroxylating dioxygenase subunit alpha [Cyanobacteria bacterium J06632_3]